MTNPLRAIRYALFFGVVLFGLALLIGFFILRSYSKDLPQLDSLKDYNPPVVSEVFSSDGTKIGEFWTEKRYILAPQEIPKTLIQAIVASEDDRFFEHKGIDYFGIVRAFFENLKAGHVVQGGSTITQQVTKSLLLTPERKISRKIKEAILATRIEQNFNKDEILYLYLNQIFLGNRSYGVEAAARNYFHKTAKELTIAEAAMIVGLAKAPTTYSPINSPELAKQRQRYVIERMYEVGYITKEQKTEAENQNLQIYIAETDKEFNARHTPWFTEYIRRTIQEKYGNELPYTGGFKIETTLDLNNQIAADKAIDRGVRELDHRLGFAGPLKSFGNNDALITKEANETHLKLIKEDHFNKTDGLYDSRKDSELLKLPTPIDADHYYQAVITNITKEGAKVKIGNREGLITQSDLTWSKRKNPYRKTNFNKDGLQRGDVIVVKVKSASDINASVVALTLEQEPALEAAFFSYEPETGAVKAMVGGRNFQKSEFNRAIQATRQTGSTIKPFIYASALDKGYTPESIIEDSPLTYEYTPGKFWSPQNYGGGFKGPTSFRSGLVNSRNVVTVRILMDIGVDYLTAFARKLGITTPIQRYYAMALGANDMHLSEISRAYGVFETGGVLPTLQYINRITDRTGKIIEENEPKPYVSFERQLDSMRTADKSKMRDDLFADGQKWIDADHLKLNDSEKKILYGNYIPEGYTISPKTAYTMTQLLNDVVNNGTGYKVKELGRPAAGKTGTTNDETDVWFLGFVPHLFAGVWIGYDELQKIGNAETGGKAAAPVFLYYMQDVLKGKPIESFKIPDEINSKVLNAPLDLSDDDSETNPTNSNSINTGGKDKGGTDFYLNDF